MRKVVRSGVLLSMLVAMPILAQPDLEAQVPLQAEQQEIQQAEAMRSPVTSATLRQVQEALQRRGYAVDNSDGRWSEQTASALRDFQQAQGLEPSGQLNSRTLGALGLGGG